MKLFELINWDEYRKNLEEGFIRVQQHPQLPLMIGNYTEKAQYANVWNSVTSAFRGLIWDYETEEIVARPFPKFFNYGQPGAPELQLSASCRAFDKLDGSLGIMYPTPLNIDGYAIATRGSFTSEQAIHGTSRLQDIFRNVRWEPWINCTYLFEIIYPENRIVVDYGMTDDLILIDVLDNRNGEPAVDYAWNYPGPWVEDLEYETLADALVAAPRPNAEGFVLYFPDTNDRVKFKQEDYLRLHRIVTGLNSRRIWEHLSQGGTTEELLSEIPDEFHTFVIEVSFALQLDFERLKLDIEETYSSVISELNFSVGNSLWSRKDFAIKVKDLPNSWAYFTMLDGKDIDDGIWKQLRPVAEVSLRAQVTEETA